jgi:hypothetical protein
MMTEADIASASEKPIVLPKVRREAEKQRAINEGTFFPKESFLKRAFKAPVEKIKSMGSSIQLRGPIRDKLSEHKDEFDPISYSILEEEVGPDASMLDVQRIIEYQELEAAGGSKGSLWGNPANFMAQNISKVLEVPEGYLEMGKGAVKLLGGVPASLFFEVLSKAPLPDETKQNLMRLANANMKNAQEGGNTILMVPEFIIHSAGDLVSGELFRKIGEGRLAEGGIEGAALIGATRGAASRLAKLPKKRWGYKEKVEPVPEAPVEPKAPVPQEAPAPVAEPTPLVPKVRPSVEAFKETAPAAPPVPQAKPAAPVIEPLREPGFKKEFIPEEIFTPEELAAAPKAYEATASAARNPLLKVQDALNEFRYRENPISEVLDKLSRGDDIYNPQHPLPKRIAERGAEVLFGNNRWMLPMAPVTLVKDVIRPAIGKHLLGKKNVHLSKAGKLALTENEIPAEGFKAMRQVEETLPAPKTKMAPDKPPLEEMTPERALKEKIAQEKRRIDEEYPGEPISNKEFVKQGRERDKKNALLEKAQQKLNEPATPDTITIDLRQSLREATGDAYRDLLLIRKRIEENPENKMMLPSTKSFAGPNALSSTNKPRVINKDLYDPKKGQPTVENFRDPSTVYQEILNGMDRGVLTDPALSGDAPVVVKNPKEELVAKPTRMSSAMSRTPASSITKLEGEAPILPMGKGKLPIEGLLRGNKEYQNAATEASRLLEWGKVWDMGLLSKRKIPDHQLPGKLPLPVDVRPEVREVWKRNIEARKKAIELEWKAKEKGASRDEILDTIRPHTHKVPVTTEDLVKRPQEAFEAYVAESFAEHPQWEDLFRKMSAQERKVTNELVRGGVGTLVFWNRNGEIGRVRVDDRFTGKPDYLNNVTKRAQDIRNLWDKTELVEGERPRVTVEFDRTPEVFNRLGGDEFAVKMAEKYAGSLVNTAYEVLARGDPSDFLTFVRSDPIHINAWYARNRGNEVFGPNSEITYSHQHTKGLTEEQKQRLLPIDKPDQLPYAYLLTQKVRASDMTNVMRGTEFAKMWADLYYRWLDEGRPIPEEWGLVDYRDMPVFYQKAVERYLTDTKSNPGKPVPMRMPPQIANTIDLMSGKYSSGLHKGGRGIWKSYDFAMKMFHKMATTWNPLNWRLNHMTNYILANSITETGFPSLMQGAPAVYLGLWKELYWPKTGLVPRHRQFLKDRAAGLMPVSAKVPGTNYTIGEIFHAISPGGTYDALGIPGVSGAFSELAQTKSPDGIFEATVELAKKLDHVTTRTYTTGLVSDAAFKTAHVIYGLRHTNKSLGELAKIVNEHLFRYEGTQPIVMKYLAQAFPFLAWKYASMGATGRAFVSRAWETGAMMLAAQQAEEEEFEKYGLTVDQVRNSMSARDASSFYGIGLEPVGVDGDGNPIYMDQDGRPMLVKSRNNEMMLPFSVELDWARKLGGIGREGGGAFDMLLGANPVVKGVYDLSDALLKGGEQGPFDVSSVLGRVENVLNAGTRQFQFPLMKRIVNAKRAADAGSIPAGPMVNGIPTATKDVLGIIKEMITGRPETVINTAASRAKEGKELVKRKAQITTDAKRNIRAAGKSEEKKNEALERHRQRIQELLEERSRLQGGL